MTRFDAAAAAAAIAGPLRVVPEPTEPRPEPAPTLDPSALHGVLGRIVRAADPTTEAAAAGVLGSLLTMVSGLIGPGPHLRIGNTLHPLLVWTLLMGSTGSGRKGEAASTASLFVAQAEADELGQILVGGLSSGEGLIERIRDPDPDKPDDGGTEDKRLIVVETEFASVLARARREGSTLATVLRQAWDGGRLGVMNRRQLVASSSHVAITGHITPREFRAKLSAADMAGGSYNRYLPLHVARSKVLPIPEGIDDTTLGELALALRKAISNARTVGRIRLGEGATKLWDAGGMYRELTTGADEGPVAEFTQRSAPYVLRLGAMYAALRGEAWISEDDLTAARALVTYAVESAKFVLSAQPTPAEVRLAEERAARLREAVDRAPDGLDRAAIDRLFAGHVKVAERDEIIVALTSTGDYAQLPDPDWSGKGRQARLLVKVAR